MKALLSGNEAIARGFYEAGGKFASAYPGTPSTEILENLKLYSEIDAQWSPNEKVALEIAAGTGLGGIRCLVSMKNVGLNVAADPLFSLAYQGTNAGIVIISADDPSMHSSQNEQDNRWYAKAAKVPMLEPSDSHEAKTFVIKALEISEQFDVPVLIRTTTRVNHSYSIVEINDPVRCEKRPYRKNPEKNVLLVPLKGYERRLAVEKRLRDLEEFSNACEFNRIEWGDREFGIISSGISYQYAREVFPDASFLKLGFTFPLPSKCIKEFAAHIEKIHVIEELDPFLEEQIAAMGVAVEGKSRIPKAFELSPDIIARAFNVEGRDEKIVPIQNNNIPKRPPVLCPGCSHRGLFFALRKLGLTVTGDIGCHTLAALPPLESIDSNLCMGAGFGYAFGMEKAGGIGAEGKVIGVLGDSTFFHSGIAPLMDIVYNGGKTKLCILDNRTTAMTGHQDHPGTGFSLSGEESYRIDIGNLCRALGVRRVIKVDPHDIEVTTRIIAEEMNVDEPSVIIAESFCIVRERKGFKKPYTINSIKCNKCDVCHELGCPALEKDVEGKATISSTLCTGCDLCRQVCEPEAIEKSEP